MEHHLRNTTQVCLKHGGCRLLFSLFNSYSPFPRFWSLLLAGPWPLFTVNVPVLVVLFCQICRIRHPDQAERFWWFTTEETVRYLEVFFSWRCDQRRIKRRLNSRNQVEKSVGYLLENEASRIYVQGWSRAHKDVITSSLIQTEHMTCLMISRCYQSLFKKRARSNSNESLCTWFVLDCGSAFPTFLVSSCTVNSRHGMV